MGNKSSRGSKATKSNGETSRVVSIAPPKTIFDNFSSLLKEGKIPDASAQDYQDVLSILKAALRNFDVEGKDQALHLAGEKLQDEKFTRIVSSFLFIIETMGNQGIPEAVPDKIFTCPITVLSLRDNGLTTSSVENIVLIIREEATIPIVALDLSMNSIDDEGGKALMEAVAANSTLKMLDLSFNKIGNQSLVAAGEMLTKNTTLLSLNLISNVANEDGIAVVISKLNLNTTVTDMRVDFHLCKDVTHSQRSRYITERNQNVRDIIKDMLNYTPKREFKKKMENMKGSYRSQSNLVVAPAPPPLKTTKSTSELNASPSSSSAPPAESSSPPVENRRFSRHMSVFGNFSQLPLHKLMQIEALNHSKASQGSHSQKIIRPSSRFDVGVADLKGHRPTMEDCAVIHGEFRGKIDEDYFAVFDGHGGRDASEFVAAHLHQTLASTLDSSPDTDPKDALTTSFDRLNHEMVHWCVHMGTTAAVVYIRGNDIFVGNAGDTRVVYSVDGIPTRLSFDHRPDHLEEIARISSLGGFIREGRVCGVLAVSRAFGDAFLAPYVTAIPYVSKHSLEIKENAQQAIIIACDGVWDVMSDAEVSILVRNKLEIGSAKEAAATVADTALHRGSTDNITVIVIAVPRKSKK